MDNPEPENNESRNRKIKNALVSGTFKPGSTEDLKLLANLFVRTGHAAGTSSSSVWQHFGPLYGKCVMIITSYTMNNI
jgi:hypothetical protein